MRPFAPSVDLTSRRPIHPELEQAGPSSHARAPVCPTNSDEQRRAPTGDHEYVVASTVEVIPCPTPSLRLPPYAAPQYLPTAAKSFTNSILMTGTTTSKRMAADRCPPTPSRSPRASLRTPHKLARPPRSPQRPHIATSLLNASEPRSRAGTCANCKCSVACPSWSTEGWRSPPDVRETCSSGSIPTDMNGFYRYPAPGTLSWAPTGQWGRDGSVSSAHT